MPATTSLSSDKRKTTINDNAYLRTLQGRGQLSRYLADVVEVAFIRRSIEYHAIREVTIYFDAKRGKLVRIGNEVGCTCGYPLYEVNPAEAGGAFHWESNQKALLVKAYYELLEERHAN